MYIFYPTPFIEGAAIDVRGGGMGGSSPASLAEIFYIREIMHIVRFFHLKLVFICIVYELKDEIQVVIFFLVEALK